MADFIKVLGTEDLKPGESKLVEVQGKKIALFNVEESYYAIADACTHRGGSLSKGSFSGEIVTCPRHRARFNVKTGEVLSGPAKSPVVTYPVKIDGSDVKAALE